MLVTERENTTKTTTRELPPNTLKHITDHKRYWYTLGNTEIQIVTQATVQVQDQWMQVNALCSKTTDINRERECVCVCMSE